VRGVKVVQGYGYWMGRRWLTYLSDCPASLAIACAQIAASGARSCIVTAVDDQPLGGGDIAALLRLEKAAAGRPIRLKLEGCSGPDPGELVLRP
jgi:hypothetical protein